MPARIDTSQPIQPATPQTPPQQAASPVGISSQPTTITPEADSSCFCSSCLKRIGNFFLSIGNFFRSICATVLETIGSVINALASCLRGDPSLPEPSSDEWMLPGDVAETPQVEPPGPTVNAPPQPSTPTQVAPPGPTVIAPPQPSGPTQVAPPGPTVIAPPQPSAPTQVVPPRPTVNAPPAPPPVADPFSSLPIAPQEKRKIYSIVHTLGTTSLLDLWPQQPTLERLGREIEHVHPLKFLEYILLHNTLRTDLDTIHNSSMLWPRFLEGLSRKLGRERAGLPNYIPGFARSMQIDPARLQPFLSSGNWQAMVFFLLDVKLGRIILPPPPPIPVAPPPTNVPAPQPIPSEPATRPTINTPTPAPSPSAPDGNVPAPQPGPPPPSAPPVANTPAPEPEPSVPAANVQAPQLPDEPVLTAWQQIALSNEQKEMVTQIIETHQDMSYYNASYLGDRYVASLWDRLKQDQVHPLPLLAHLFTTPEYVAKLDTLWTWTYRMHRRYFVSELTTFLDRRPESAYLPHIADFSQAVEEEEPTIIAHVHFRRWGELIEILKTSSGY